MVIGAPRGMDIGEPRGMDPGAPRGMDPGAPRGMAPGAASIIMKGNDNSLIITKLAQERSFRRLGLEQKHVVSGWFSDHVLNIS